MSTLIVRSMTLTLVSLLRCTTVVFGACKPVIVKPLCTSEVRVTATSNLIAQALIPVFRMKVIGWDTTEQTWFVFPCERDVNLTRCLYVDVMSYISNNLTAVL